MTEIYRYDELLSSLRANPKKWLITGVAGFIGSNLLETLLLNDQWVVGLDNFATGSKLNLDAVRLIVGDKWQKFTLIEADIRDIDKCRSACLGVDYVLHQAALGSVPRSINDPLLTNSTNIDGFLSMLVAAKDSGWKALLMLRLVQLMGIILDCLRWRILLAIRYLLMP